VFQVRVRACVCVCACAGEGVGRRQGCEDSLQGKPTKQMHNLSSIEVACPQPLHLLQSRQPFPEQTSC
jgi:hypothetical protein